jgi:hypothetical protein
VQLQPAGGAPEVDADSFAVPVALVAGGMVLAMDRWRRVSKPAKA